jgi:RNA polymerase sigma-70 factor (ECF subfamily)
VHEPEDVTGRLNPQSLSDSAECEPSAAVPLDDTPPAPTFVRLSFEDIYERYFEFVWRSLRLLGVARASLDDAVQDVFGVVSQKLPRFEGRSSYRTWVFGIAQYTANNHRRKERRKSAPLEPLYDAIMSPEPSPQARAEAKQLADVVLRFSAALDEGRRAVFVLGILEDVPAAEIAELLHIPVNTVYSRARSLRQALRAELERREVAQ